MREAAGAGGIEVVIPSWNRFELLERCLTTLSRQTVPHTVIVVDNGSTDGTPKRLAGRFPAVRLISLSRNAGFARAVNCGIAAGSADTVILINNDVEPDPTFLESIVEPLQTDPRIGSVAGVLLVPGRERVDSYGIELDRTLAAFNRFAGLRYRPDRLDERHLAGASGGAAAYRRSALETVGGFDERLFAYMEDVDVALRLRAAGWRAAGARSAVGVHLGSATFGSRSRWQVEVSGASRAYMLRKYAILSSGLAGAAPAVATEIGVVLADVVTRHDLAALRGRMRGWQSAACTRAPVPPDAINHEIRFWESVRRRAAAL